MKSIAVMQPYFFPYIGYFQLISAVDRFIFYDDVTFIKNGWINRNRILIGKEAKYLTIPSQGASSNQQIRHINHGLDTRLRKKLNKKISFAYGKAPFFEAIKPIFDRVLHHQSHFIADLAIASVIECSRYLGLTCSFDRSSEIFDNAEMDAADRLIDICRKESCQRYINPAGGKELYGKDYFHKNGIDLHFIQPELVEYEQAGGTFIPGLSILDVMMFNSREEIRARLLGAYQID